MLCVYCDNEVDVRGSKVFRTCSKCGELLGEIASLILRVSTREQAAEIVIRMNGEVWGVSGLHWETDGTAGEATVDEANGQ